MRTCCKLDYLYGTLATLQHKLPSHYSFFLYVTWVLTLNGYIGALPLYKIEVENSFKVKNTLLFIEIRDNNNAKDTFFSGCPIYCKKRSHFAIFYLSNLIALHIWAWRFYCEKWSVFFVLRYEVGYNK